MYKYVHGGDIYGDTTEKAAKLLDYSANINPLGLPTGVKMAIKAAIKDCVAYPDPFCRRLVAGLAKHLGVKEQYIFCSNGAADVLFKLALALQPKQTLLLAPTFADYEKAVASVGSRVEYYPLREETGYRLEGDILKYLGKKLDLVIICNPNNPTGQITERELLLKIAAKCMENGTTLLVDECFLDFVVGGKDLTLLQELEAYPNLIILKAFTKTYAMPGLRLGYCVTANPQLLDRVRECGQDWNVSTLAQAAGIAALEEKEYVQEAKELIANERDYLKKQLEFLGFTVYDGHANYILFRSNKGFDWAKALRERDILIRDCSNYHNLGKYYYRIAVKKRDVNRILVNTMKEIIKHEIVIRTR